MVHKSHPEAGWQRHAKMADYPIWHIAVFLVVSFCLICSPFNRTTSLFAARQHIDGRQPAPTSRFRTVVIWVSRDPMTTPPNMDRLIVPANILASQPRRSGAWPVCCASEQTPFPQQLELRPVPPTILSINSSISTTYGSCKRN